MPAHPVSFRILSSVDVRVDASSVLKVAAPGQRALLAQLLVNANQTVRASTLIDGIWGGAPPQRPESALHIVVCRLRRALDVVAPRLVRDGTGYRMELDPDELDLTRAQAYEADACLVMQEGDPRRAAEIYDAALACWTGEPLADLANFPFYDATARHLRELRLGIVESRNGAYLRCGRHLDVLKDVDSWIQTEPWRERLRAHQMVALYRSGRQIESLAAYEDLRRLLVTEFGVDPHADIQRLHGRILRRDPTLLDDRGAARPRDHDTLVERLREIALDRADVVVVEGGPGVDKTWLVAELPNPPREEATSREIDLRSAPRRVSLTEWLATTR
jgi:DNA-binding SARP family transcriptional activator